MKKRAWTWGGCVAIVLAIGLFCIAVSAGTGREQQNPNARLKQEKVSELTKTVQTDRGENKTVNYVGTDEDRSTPLAVYEDEGGNQYAFNSEGEISYYANKSDREADETVNITQETAVDFGWKYMQELYGDRLDGFQFVHCYQDRTNPVGYSVKYGKLYGKGGFILGSFSLVMFFEDGVIRASILEREDLLDYDPALLADMTEEKIAEAIKTARNVTDVEVDVVQLVTENGKPALRVGCRINGVKDQYVYAL